VIDEQWVNKKWKSHTDLIIFVQGFKIAHVAKLLYFLVAQAYSVIEISKPDYSVMILDRSVPLKSQTMTDSLVVPVPFFIICEASRKMCGNEADRCVGIIHANGYCAFVTCYAGHAGL